MSDEAEQVQGERVIEVDYEAMYRAELVNLVALGTSLTGSRETGADLAHEAMLRAYRAWPRVSTFDRPGAWVRRVLINLAADSHRRGRSEQRALRRVESMSPLEPNPAIDSPFWSAVRALPERQRFAVALRYIDDFSIDEIADVLQVKPGTIKASLFAARKTLAATLGAEEES